jgi:hypothetical protein
MTAKALRPKPSYAPLCASVQKSVAAENGLTDLLPLVARFASAGVTMPTGAILITPIVGFVPRHTLHLRTPSLVRLRAVPIDAFVKSSAVSTAMVHTRRTATLVRSFWLGLILLA